LDDHEACTPSLVDYLLPLPDTDWKTDEYGHGTLSAGIIAAQDNDLGLIGVSPGVNIIVAKVVDAVGEVTVANLLSAVEQCRDQVTRIINISLGG
jgi:serine protease